MVYIVYHLLALLRLEVIPKNETLHGAKISRVIVVHKGSVHLYRAPVSCTRIVCVFAQKRVCANFIRESLDIGNMYYSIHPFTNLLQARTHPLVSVLIVEVGRV